MSQPYTPLPELPHEIEDVSLFQWVSDAALEEEDPAIRSQMDLRVLFALGAAAWMKMEIHARIMMGPDPEIMLVSILLSNGVGGDRDSSPSQLSLRPPMLLASRALRAAIICLPTQSGQTLFSPTTYVYKLLNGTLTNCV